MQDLIESTFVNPFDLNGLAERSYYMIELAEQALKDIQFQNFHPVSLAAAMEYAPAAIKY